MWGVVRAEVICFELVCFELVCFELVCSSAFSFMMINMLIPERNLLSAKFIPAIGGF